MQTILAHQPEIFQARLIAMPETVKNRNLDKALEAYTSQPKEVLADTFETSPTHPGAAHVVSKTVCKDTGTRNEYDLSFAFVLATERLPERIRVMSCGCLHFFGNTGCRHAIALFDVLNLPEVLLAMQNPGAFVRTACLTHFCGYCRVMRNNPKQPVYRVRYYAGVHGGYQLAHQCPACLQLGGATL